MEAYIYDQTSAAKTLEEAGDKDPSSMHPSASGKSSRPKDCGHSPCFQDVCQHLKGKKQRSAKSTDPAIWQFATTCAWQQKYMQADMF